MREPYHSGQGYLITFRRCKFSWPKPELYTWTSLEIWSWGLVTFDNCLIATTNIQLYQRNSKYEKEAFQESPKDYKEVSRLNQVIRFVQSNITTVYDIDIYITVIKTFGKIEFVKCYFENMRLHLSVSGEGLMNLSVDASILYNGVEFVISELERSISLFYLNSVTAIFQSPQ